LTANRARLTPSNDHAEQVLRILDKRAAGATIL